jgi:protein gp37
MNKQEKRKGGKVVGRGIEWTDWTWNPIGGCRHACQWAMPDGSIAICYAEEVANGVAQKAYPQGFEAHYWRPDKLDDPLKIKKPAKIFLDSMSDLMGHWVPDDQINSVLDVCRKADYHTFQLLTKNAPRLLKFDFPPNVWVGVSSPPDFMWGKPLSRQSQEQMLTKSLEVLSQIDNVTWISAEPLSWDIAPIVEQYPKALDWVVIGAASNGPKKYQPNSDHIHHLLYVLDKQRVPVFFKGNLDWSLHREDFPDNTQINRGISIRPDYLKIDNPKQLQFELF